ncbi:hypothetical protein OIU77_013607 [Salix suchowensis]|uniref:Cytochrome P450 90A1 n=1 Tax=Salix suchowensis TaxID=1278906 RepID=A0ABQ8ZUS3_9ROSI|nr:hypothetical protein OIU77_013607 [Salix suchowensis]
MAAVFLYLVFSVALPAIIFIVHRSSRCRRLRLPPGSLGLPFVGETLQLISAYKTENPEPFIDERGNLHKKMHSLTMSFANSSIIRDHLLVDIDRLIRLNLDSWPERVLLMEEAKKITFELTMKQLMSFDPCEWTESLRKEYVLVIEGFFSVPLPIFSPTYRRAIKARTKVAEALSLVVKQRRIESESGEKRKDMLGALLASDDDGGLSDEGIVDFLVALLVAGYETTSTSMTLAVKFLTETPLALAQIMEEHEQIRAKKGEGEALEWSDYKSMTFTQCVVNETLRIANIIGGIFRRTMTDINVKGYTIPKGWKVFASFRGVHLDHEYFKDARTFNPWRWQNNSGATCPANVFTPFGGGQRLCPGYELARVELSVFLHHLVTRFSWTPAEEDKLVFFPTTRTQKRYPYQSAASGSCLSHVNY